MACYGDRIQKEVMEIYKEDISLFDDSVFYVALNSAKIVGSVKITRWNNNITLPIQKLFDINPLDIDIKYMNYGRGAIWHIGRFAISKNVQEGACLLKQLITLAIYPICQDINSIMVAECDRKFVRGLNLLGIKTATLAPGKQYLGSETLPIFSTQEWLQLFLEKSIYLGEVTGIYKRNPFRYTIKKKEMSNDEESLRVVSGI